LLCRGRESSSSDITLVSSKKQPFGRARFSTFNLLQRISNYAFSNNFFFEILVGQGSSKRPPTVFQTVEQQPPILLPNLIYLVH
jgi:hypothetical protein